MEPDSKTQSQFPNNPSPKARQDATEATNAKHMELHSSDQAQSSNYLSPKARHEETEATKAYLEQLAHLMMNAFNENDFDPASPAWSHMSRTGDFYLPTAGETHLLNTLHTVDYRPERTGMLVPLTQHLTQMKSVRQMEHNYEMHIVGMVSKVDLKKGTGRTFMNVETRGFMNGVVLHSVGVLEWRLIGERWLCVASRGLRGFGGQD